MKACTKCNNIKSLSEFNKSHASMDKVSSWCRNCFKVYNKARYAKNKIEMIKYSQEYRKNHPDAKIKYDIEYKKKNRERVNFYARQCRSRNKDKFRIHDAKNRHRRRAAIKNTTTDYLTHDQWLEIQARQKGRCYYCSCLPKSLDMDHVMPISKGGEHKASNIVGACKSCNCSKQAKHPDEWAKKIGKLFI